MNGIVAIGNQNLLTVAQAYATLNATVVWSLGIPDFSDRRLRGLEPLLAPFMEAYFSVQAQTLTAALTSAPPEKISTSLRESSNVAAAIASTLDEELISCLRLIEMLDRANVLHPVQLMLVSDEDGSQTRTGVSWAKARGIPSILIADPALRDVIEPNADHIITFGSRGYAAYEALGLAEPRVEVLANPKMVVMSKHAESRETYRSTLQGSGVIGTTADYLICFEPSRLDPAAHPTMETPREASLHAMFAALRFAREKMPSLRLALIETDPMPSDSDRVAQIAEQHGVPANSFAYVVSDTDAWVSTADLMVSVDSLRSVEACFAHVPAINLWQAESWYRGPAFSVGDGIIEATPDALGSTVLAMASNSEVGRELAAAAYQRGGAFGLIPAAEGKRDAVVQVAEQLARYRLPGAAAVHIKEALEFVVFAPDYVLASAGVRSLYRLCHLLNTAGAKASISPATTVHPTWNTPKMSNRPTEKTIVIYPETSMQKIAGTRTVRWVLNVPGLLAGPTHYDDDELVFYYTYGLRDAAQAATSQLMTDARELFVSTIDPEIFYPDRSIPKLYDCVYIGKGEQLYERLRVSHAAQIENAIVIRRGDKAWPASRLETAALLRGCRRLYSYDGVSAIMEEAIICGAEVFHLRHGDEFEKLWLKKPDYIKEYFDTSAVERFIRVVDAHWS